MAGNNLSVSITADAASLQSQFAIAQASTRALTAEMNTLARASVNGGLDEAGAAKLQEVAGAMLRAKEQAAGLKAELAEMRESSAGVGASFEELKSKISGALQFTGVALAVEGFRQLGEVVENLGGRAVEISNMADVLNVTSAQLQAMQAAAEEAGIGTEQLFRGTEKLSQGLEQARSGSTAAIDAMHNLGVSTEEIQDPTFKITDLLKDLHERLNDSNTSVATMTALTKELGARGALTAEAIKGMELSEEGVAEAMVRLNGLNDTQIEGLKAAKAWWGEVATEISNTSAKVLEYTTGRLRALSSTTSQKPAESVGALSDQYADNYSEAADKIRAINAQETQVILGAIQQQIAATKSGSEARVSLLQEYSNVARSIYGEDSEAFRASQLKIIEATREASEARQTEAQRLQEELNSFYESTSEKARTAMTSSYEEILAAQQAALKQQETAQAAEIEREISAVKTLGETRKITAAQELAQTQALLKQKLALEQDYYTQVAALATSPQQTNSIHDESVSAYQANLTAMQAAQDRFDQQIYADAQRTGKQQVSAWKSAVGEIESAESTLVSNLLTKHKSLSASLESIAASLVQQEITNDLKAMTTRVALANTEEAQKKAAEQGGYLYHLTTSAKETAATVQQTQTQTAATQAGNTAQLTSQETAAVQSKAIQATMGAQQVQSAAAKAAAGAYSAIAGIPIVGPVLAPVAAGVAYAAVSAYESLASLDTGAWNVPQDMVANIHAGETVLPRPFAEEFRANGGLGGSQGGGGGGGDTHNYGPMNVSVADTDMANMLKSAKSQRAVVNALATAYRRGAR